MVVQEIDIQELTPYEKNAKIHDEVQIDNVAESIRKFGWQQPIVVDRKHVVIIGHCRLLAAKQLGLQKVPVVVADSLTPAEIRQLRIVDNKSNESAWNMELLSLELEDLDLSDFDFDFSFDLDEEEPEAAADDGYEPQIQEEAEAESGHVYLLGRHRLMCGDSTVAEDVQKLMDGALADLLLTDPPYGVDYTGGTNEALTIANDNLGSKEFTAFLTSAFRAANGVMRPGAAFYIWHADSRAGEFRQACEQTGWTVRQCLVWNKNSLVIGRQDYQWKHEPCLYGWTDGAAHLWTSDRKQTTVLEFDRPSRSKEHPTMKPIPLFDYQMRNNTNQGDRVLDLFGGSGTTLIAAEQNGRTAYCMEYDPRYVDVIIDRWEKMTGQTAQEL